jgi:superfamily II DNA or RNA helicase
MGTVAFDGMNAIASRPSPDLWDRYARLPPAPRFILQMKSLVLLPTGKTPFLECLTRGGLRTPDDKAWSGSSVNSALNELVRLGLLTNEFAIPAPFAHPIAVDAAASPQAGPMFAAVRRAFSTNTVSPHYAFGVNAIDAMGRMIWLAVHDNDATAFSASCAKFDRFCAPQRALEIVLHLFHSVVLAPDWFASRHPSIQTALFEAKLSGFVTTGLPPAGMDTVLTQLQAQPDRQALRAAGPSLALLDLLALRLDRLPTAIEALDPSTMAVARLSLLGSAAFVKGENDAALGFFREALKLRRKQASKRKVSLEGMHAVFFLMAQLRANDPALQPDIQTGLEIGLSSLPQYSGCFIAVQAMLWLVQGLQAKARDLIKQARDAMPDEPLSAACIALAEHSVDPDLSRLHRADLAARFAQLKDSLPLVARILAEIQAAVASNPASYAAYLQATAPGVGIAFTQLIAVRQPWERALESLDALLGGVSPNLPTPIRKAKRLAWFIDPETQAIDAAEQAAKGNGGWSDGRAIAMKRLHEQDPRLDYLTDQDRKVLRAIRKESASGWYGEYSFSFDPLRALPALVGHPAVFDARRRSQPIELVAYPLELVVAERKGGYHVALSHSADAPAVFLEPETPSRYRVIEFPQKMLPLQQILGSRGLTVPRSARDRLVAQVQRDKPTLPVRDEIGATVQVAQDGLSTPVVQLAPYADGLKVTLLVRVFGPDGPAYVAGLGGRSVLANVAGEQKRANRDLDREVAERAALIDACPTLRDRWGADAQDLIVEDVEGCLELLLELQAYTGPAAIEWPARRIFQVAPVTPQKMKLRVAKDRDWFGVSGEVALDDGEVVEMRFLLDRLDRAQGRFVPLGDGRFLALTRHLQGQLQQLAAVSEPHKAGRRVHALGAPALDAVLAEAGEVSADAPWKRHVSRIRAAEGWTPKLPATLQADLRDYQVEGFVWLSRLARWGAGACLADDMGLGKTVQAIAVMLDRADSGPCLVVAPTSVCPNWVAEIVRFAPTLTVHRFGDGDREALVAGLGARDVLVCSYGLLQLGAALLAGREWQMVVLDEAQAIKNTATKRTQAVLDLQAGFRLALTGTPVENDLDELWSLFSFVNPGLLGSREGFQKRFAGPIERDRNPAARQALRGLIRPFLLRRTKSAVLNELPPRTEQTIRVEMTDAERAFYEALRQRALERIDALDAAAGQRKIHILAEITRMRRACCNPALIDDAAAVPSGKLEALLTLVDELIRNRHRALLFSQFTGHLALVRAALDARGIRYEYLDGSTPAADRERRVAAFQAGGADLFLISLRAGGTGLNLTAADYVVHLDPWWNPAVEDQASDRAHRIGQMRPVTVYRLIMADSIEERILKLHNDKRDLASELLEGAEVTARLGEAELLGLIRG